MATAFEQILDLKHRKEEKAQTDMRIARLAVEQAARLVEQRREEARQYTLDLAEHQTRVYDELQTRVHTRREVEEVREQIGLLREKEAALYRTADEAEKARAAAADAFETARLAHLFTVKNVEKFQELVTLEHEEAAHLEQASEDKEMEEFVRLGEPADF